MGHLGQVGQLTRIFRYKQKRSQCCLGSKIEVGTLYNSTMYFLNTNTCYLRTYCKTSSSCFLLTIFWRDFFCMHVGGIIKILDCYKLVHKVISKLWDISFTKYHLFRVFFSFLASNILRPQYKTLSAFVLPCG